MGGFLISYVGGQTWKCVRRALYRLTFSVSVCTTLDEVMSSMQGYLLNDEGVYFHYYSLARLYGTRMVILCGKKGPMCLYGASGELVLHKQPKIDLTAWEATCS